MNILKKLLLLFCIAPTGIVVGMHDEERKTVPLNLSDPLTTKYETILEKRDLYNRNLQRLDNVRGISLFKIVSSGLSPNTKSYILSNFSNDSEYLNSLQKNPISVDTMTIIDKNNNETQTDICYIDYISTENAINSKVEKKYQNEITDLKQTISKLTDENNQLKNIKQSNENMIHTAIDQRDRLETAAIMGSVKQSKSEQKAIDKLNFMKRYTLPFVGFSALLLGGLVAKIHSHFYPSW